MVSAFKERHDYLVDALNSIDGVNCVPGDGTFYAFAQVDGLMAKAKVSNDVELCEKLLTEANVALVPAQLSVPMGIAACPLQPAWMY